MTLLGAETVGRAYGGGMLKLEPREADSLPVPAPHVVKAASRDLAALRSSVARRLAEGDLAGAVGLVDQTLLVGHLGAKPKDVRLLQAAYAELSGRRLARGGKPRGS